MNLLTFFTGISRLPVAIAETVIQQMTHFTFFRRAVSLASSLNFTIKSLLSLHFCFVWVLQICFVHIWDTGPTGLLLIQFQSWAIRAAFPGMLLISFAHLAQFAFNFFHRGGHPVAEGALWLWCLWFVVWCFLESRVFLRDNWVLIVGIFLSPYFWVIHTGSFQIRNRWLVNHFVNRNFFLGFHGLLSQILLFSIWHTRWSWNLENGYHRYALFNFGAINLHIIAAWKPFLLDQDFLSLVHLPSAASFSKIDIGLLQTFFCIKFYQLWIVCINLLALPSNCRKSRIRHLRLLCFCRTPVQISFDLRASSWSRHSSNCFRVLRWNLTHLALGGGEHLNIARRLSNSAIWFVLRLGVLWMLVKCDFLRAVLWTTSLKASALELYRMGIFSIISHVFLIFSR